MVPAPILPFIRESEFAVRSPWSLAERRLLDYLIVCVEAGQLSLFVEGTEFKLGPGDFALVQPGERHSFRAVVDTTTPYAHLDVLYNSRREESFATPPGHVDLSEDEHLAQLRPATRLGWPGGREAGQGRGEWRPRVAP